MVYDLSKNNVGSSVAAGIYNPITGKNLVKTWLADEIFPSLINYYTKMEVFYRTKLLYPIEQYRAFGSIQEANTLSSKTDSESGNHFIKSIHYESVINEIYNPYGGAFIKNSGYLDVSKFIESTRSLLIEKNMLKDEAFNINLLNVNDSLYKEIQFDKIIFCEGYTAKENPYFKKLPHAALKGELIEIIMDYSLDKIINKGVFILPQLHKKNTTYLVGSTYNRDEINTQTSNKGLQELEDKLRKILIPNYKIINHFAGIRPSTINRRPLLGFHPNFKTIGIVNGLGTKGVSLAPYFIDNFIDFIEKKSDLMKEVNIEQYF